MWGATTCSLVPILIYVITSPYSPPPCYLHWQVGAPISVDRTVDPSREQVNALHATYCAALRELYDQHKEQYAPNRKRDMCFVR